MNSLDFLHDLAIQGVELWADGGRLRYRAPKDVLTPTLVTTLKEHKPALLQLLATRADATKPFPLTHGQRALWFLYQLDLNSPAYNIACALRLQPDLDVAALQHAVDALVKRHPVLRTTYHVIDGEPIQQVHAHLDVPVTQTVDADRWDEVRIDAWLQQEADRPFDLQQTSSLRVHLLSHGTSVKPPTTQEHILALTTHHIGADFWSMEVLLDELCKLYAAYRSDTIAVLPPLTWTYRDHVYREADRLAGKEGKALWDYWQTQLAGDQSALNLPTDRPRPAVQTQNGVAHAFTIDETLSNALRSLAKTLGTTPFVVLHAAYQVLLARYANQEEFYIGTPVFGRSGDKLDCIIGYFANPVVLRADLTNNPTFSELCARVNETRVGALAHQDYPFPLLVDQLQLERDASRTPLFQVTFVWDRARRSAGLDGFSPAQSELIAECLCAEQRGSAFDLTLNIIDGGEALAGELRGNADLFELATLARMTEHYCALLTGIAADPTQRIADLPLLTVTEQHEMVAMWNATQADFPSDLALHQLFEAQVARTPDAVAVRFDGETLTYRDLNCRANQLAHRLQSVGVGPESLVGVCMERSLEMVVALFGTLKAGGAYVPLDPSYPAERLAYMVDNAQANIMLTQQRLQRRLPSQPAQVLCLDSEWHKIARQPTENPVSSVEPQNPAYVIYTSGSTGQPKGVVIPHRAICNHMHWMCDEFPLTADDRVLQKTPFSFDASIWEFYAPLLSGAQLIMARPDGHADVHYLVQTIQDEGITTIQLVPSMLRLLLEKNRLQSCTTLRRVFCGGEALRPDLRDRFFVQLPNATLHNLYGPSEATVEVAFWSGQANGAEPQQPDLGVPIGRPITNTQLYVLDRNLNPVPAGVAGELYIGGANLGRGYRRRPDITAERYVPNPFHPDPGQRLYRTGDLVRYMTEHGQPTRNLEFLERIDRQLKLHGYRIELGEIEAALLSHHAVQQAVANLHTDDAGNQRLVAYCIAAQHRNTANQEALTDKQLRAHLKTRLPTYMIPTTIVLLDALPLTPSGKVDRRALPAPIVEQPQTGTSVEARTSVEEQLASVWQHSLGIDEVGIHDNFFELGGDSIQGIKMVALASDAGIQLSPKHLFQYQTIAELAQVAGAKPIIQATQGRVTGAVPLTPIQQRFFAQEYPDPQHWNQALWLEVQTPLDPVLLEEALCHVIDHHDALRLRFVQTESGWQQTNAGHDDRLAIVYEDLSALPPEAASTAMRTSEEKLQRSLNLKEGPLLRVALFDCGPTRAQNLLIIIHHLAVDGVSWRIFVEDLESAYHQLALDVAVQLPTKTTSFQQWATRLTEYAQTNALDAEMAYWQKIATAAAQPMPMDNPHGANREAVSEYIDVYLTADETNALLKVVPPVYQTQINDVLLTALAQIWQQWTGQRHLLVDLEGHGREPHFDDVDVGRTVGWFTAIFPVVLELAHGADLGTSLKTIKEQLRAIPHHGIGYGLLHYLRQNTERLALHSSAAICFNYLGQTTQSIDVSTLFKTVEISDGPTRSPRNTRPHLLEINSWLHEGRLVMRWSFSGEIHQRATISRMAESYLTALRAIIEHCQAPDAGGYTPSDFDVDLSQDELDDVLAELGALEHAM